jgi:hypothetical protein
MYITLLALHNLLRWLFLGTLLTVVFKSFMGSQKNTPYSPTDKKIGGILVALAHTQLLIGIILLLTSPVIAELMQDMAATMKDKVKRAQLVEHPIAMILAVVLIQVARIRVKKAYADEDKHKRTLLLNGIALLLVLYMIPWQQTPLFIF